MKRLLLTIGACVCLSAHAEFKDGNALYNDIRDSSYFSQGVGLGYIMGAADASRGVAHCIPPNVTAGQVLDMTKQYLEEYPALRHFTADMIVGRVLGRVWPCETKKGQSL